MYLQKFCYFGNGFDTMKDNGKLELFRIMKGFNEIVELVVKKRQVSFVLIQSNFSNDHLIGRGNKLMSFFYFPWMNAVCSIYAFGKIVFTIDRTSSVPKRDCAFGMKMCINKA